MAQSLPQLELEVTDLVYLSHETNAFSWSPFLPGDAHRISDLCRFCQKGI